MLADGVDVAFAALSRPGAVGSRRLRRLLGKGRVLDRPDVTRPDLAERVRAERVDLIVSWFWTTRIPASVLDLAPLGSVGVHPSLLPRHRGPDPYFWAIECGDATTGVTAHRLAETYDTGAILAQRTLAIDASWNAWILARRLDRPSLALLREVVAQIRRRDAAPRAAAGRAARDVGAGAARRAPRPLLGRAGGRDRPPHPGGEPLAGSVHVARRRGVTVTRAATTDELPRALEPGEAVVRADGVAVVRAQDRGVLLLEGRDEDEEPLDAAGLARLVAGASVPFSEGLL